MAAYVLRLFAALALFLMPFGMAAPGAAHAGSAAMAGGHCDDSSAPDPSSKAMPQMHCGAACTALPANPAAPTRRIAFAPELPLPQLASRLADEQPEIAVPPPKLS